MFLTDGLYSESEALEMPFGRDLEVDVTVSGLIEIQRRLAGSEKPFERLVGTLWAAGMLDKRLSPLTDRQIGQLMFDVVADHLSFLRPETMICTQATQRLFRSAGGKLAAADIEKRRQRPACPKCGNMMLLHYGIDEPDFFECVLLKCRHKELLNTAKEQPNQ